MPEETPVPVPSDVPNVVADPGVPVVIDEQPGPSSVVRRKTVEIVGPGGNAVVSLDDFNQGMYPASEGYSLVDPTPADPAPPNTEP